MLERLVLHDPELAAGDLVVGVLGFVDVRGEDDRAVGVGRAAVHAGAGSSQQDVVVQRVGVEKDAEAAGSVEIAVLPRERPAGRVFNELDVGDGAGDTGEREGVAPRVAGRTRVAAQRSAQRRRVRIAGNQGSQTRREIAWHRGEEDVVVVVVTAQKVRCDSQILQTAGLVMYHRGTACERDHLCSPGSV